MGRLGNSWQLMMVSLGLIRSDKKILLYPLISGIVMILIGVSFIGGIFFTGFLGFAFTPLMIILFFVFYFLLFFIGIYFNTAIIAFATIKLEGGQPELGDGFRIANENMGSIFKWALVAATVGLIIRAIEERVGIIGKIIMSIIGFAWAMATFFIIPVLIYEKQPVFKGIKRSAIVFKDTWGETLVGNFGFGIFFFLLGLLGIIPIILGVMIGGFIGLIFGLVIAIIYWIVLACVANAAQGVLVAALYRYATTGYIEPHIMPAHLVTPGEMRY